MTDNQTNAGSPEQEALIPDLCSYAFTATKSRLDHMLTFADGVCANEDIEPVHQMRVWSRRLRAALEVFPICFPGKAFKVLDREVKAITGALGEARDLDVMIKFLSKRASALPENQRGGIDSFVSLLSTERLASQHAVATAVQRLKNEDLAERLVQMQSQAAECSGRAEGLEQPVGASNG